MTPLKAGIVVVGVAATAVGATELVSRLNEEDVEADQTEALQQDADQNPVTDNQDKEAFHRGFIAPLKAAMNGGSCEVRTAAFTRLVGAAAQLSKLDADLEDFFGAGDEQLIEGFVPAMRDQCTKEAYAECVEKHDFSRLLLLGAGRERQDALVDRSETDEYYEALLDQCLSFELEFESVVEIPGVGTEIRVKSLVPLRRDKAADQSGPMILHGEAPITGTMKAHLPTGGKCSQTAEGPSPKKPVKVQRLELWPDTSGQGALREEEARIMKELRALALEEQEDKATSAEDKARRARLREGLESGHKVLRLTRGAKAGKEFNKPLRIELSFDPGDISAHLIMRCPPAPPFPMDIGGFYTAGWPVAFQKYLKNGWPLFVYRRHEIQGGKLFARKSLREPVPKGTVSMTLTLWHRPPVTGIASID
jgi:hypothetical protein